MGLEINVGAPVRHWRVLRLRSCRSVAFIAIASSIGGLSCKHDSRPTQQTETVTLDGPVKETKVAAAPKPRDSAPVSAVPATFPNGEDDVRCEAPLVRTIYKLPLGSSVSCKKGEDGRQHGPFASFDSTGKLLTFGQMRDGKPDGVWTNFGADGKPTTVEEYVDGELRRKSAATARPPAP